MAPRSTTETFFFFGCLLYTSNKLMQVENTREYHAMMREMDSMEKINRSREEEKMTLMEEVQRQNEALAELDPVSYTHLDVYKRQCQSRCPSSVGLAE